jgi:uncharacterized protein YciU (UPF0263 family)
MAESPPYKRRTLDDATSIALTRFKAEARNHLTFEQFEHCLTKACLYGSGPGSGWHERVGFEPDPRMYYEVGVSEWADGEGGIPPKYWVRILVSRDRSSDFCTVWWHPDASPQGG